MICSALPHKQGRSKVPSSNPPFSLEGGQRHVAPQAQALAPSAFHKITDSSGSEV